MNRRERLARLTALAAAARRAAAARLGGAERRTNENERLLEALLGHRSDYEAAYARVASNGLEAHALRNFGDFLRKLEAAIAHQRTALSRSRDLAEGERERWRAADRNLKRYEKLEQRAAAVALKAERIHEQREQDEAAARTFPKERSP